MSVNVQFVRFIFVYMHYLCMYGYLFAFDLAVSLSASCLSSNAI